MKKIEIITDIINVYDENIELKRIIKENKNKNIPPKIDKMSEIQKSIYEAGRKEIFKKVVKAWDEVRADYDDEDNLKVTKYEDWVARKIMLDEIPKDVSHNALIIEFEDDLKELYEKEKNNAIKSLEE